VIVIRDGLIAELGTAEEIEFPEDADLIDAQGGTILPGLVDGHSHHLEELIVADGSISATRLKEYFSGLLKVGVTTVLDLGSPWGVTQEVSVLRDGLSDAGNQVPNVAITGPILAAPESNLFIIAVAKAVAINSAEEASVITKDLIGQGVDMIKIYIGSINRTSPDGRINVPSLTGGQIQAITQTAHAAGVSVIAHAVDEEAAFLAIDNGVDVFAHWPGRDEPVPAGLIEQMIAEEIVTVTIFRFFRPVPEDVRQFE
jgi:imidazolonepropionase-like amidohydrolase